MRNDTDTTRAPGYIRGFWQARHEHGPEGRRRGPEDGRRGAPGGDRRPHWGGHRGGRGGRPRVGKGDVRAAILLLLGESPLHGYQLIQRIEEQSGGLWRPSPGSVYPALQLLEDEGLVYSEQEEGRRVYHLTDAGTAYVAEQRVELEAARDAVTGRANPKAQTLHDLVHQLMVAVEQVTMVGTPSQLEVAQEVLVATRRQLYRILADDLPAEKETAGTSTEGGDAHE